MNTPSHWLMTVAAGRVIQEKSKVPNPKWALGLGSIAPDIPLYFLSFGGIWYYRAWHGWSSNDTARQLFTNLYYNDPVWILLHNFLHSPTMLLILGFAVSLLGRLGIFTDRVARRFFFFLGACLLHSFVDILTHNDDGPLIFFPFNWTYRFSSPLSYWDPDHLGRQFMVFEAILAIVLIGFLFWHRFVKRPDRPDES